MLYRRIPTDDSADIKKQIEKIKDFNITVESYDYSSNMEVRPENKAIARIQDIMYNMEVDLLEEMTNKTISKPSETSALTEKMFNSDEERRNIYL